MALGWLVGVGGCEKPEDLVRKNSNDRNSANYYNDNLQITLDTLYGVVNTEKITIEGRLKGVNASTGIQEYGIIFSTGQSPTVSDNKISYNTHQTNYQFDTTIQNVILDKTYYFKPFYKYKGDIFYGVEEQISFSNFWLPKEDFGGSARDQAVGFSIDGKGYIGTGYDGNYKKDFWQYDPGSDSWSQKADFGGSARFEAVGFSIDGKGYIGTGDHGDEKKDFWQYAP